MQTKYTVITQFSLIKLTYLDTYILQRSLLIAFDIYKLVKYLKLY